ncbi:uncharacterized protein YwqG [Thermosporothrix hazakensis]|jgi:uncharacterized protein YwqG|uniref:Uncharacterized protein YwqG n=1 Tax=Thermosporothrix hazakensis TaxID=644383 RepID=A0A326UC73_THEHA|nr:YwqG family protein [Thermosporothrix hazakensis]PZW26135.1 uncharacterized protein YwqG [Thermosporothrix hazakensis]GCE51395.1 hypothetical protein KTH_62640 [Thermosporothrix hazakensis]
MEAYEAELERQLQQIVQEIEACGLEQYKDALLARRQPALKIHLELAEQLPVGSSKVGGMPDLPPDVSYPSLIEDYGDVPRETPLTFLAQYRLQDLASFAFAREALPSDGMLYFFGLGFQSGDVVLTDCGRVIYWRGDSARLQPYAVSEGVNTYQQAKIHFEPIWSWGFHLLDESLPAECDEITGRYTSEPLHQALGIPTPIQPSDLMEDEEQLKQHVLLLQLDYVPKIGLNFGDAGTAYFLIPKKDLRECNFAHVWCEDACC